jgi:glycosyltransferase involved in cell wall biosynthesis
MDELLTIVIPAYNERSSLEANLPAWLRVCDDKGWRLIVVDDGSTDGTEVVLRAHAVHPRLQALRHRANRGYGNALKAGLFHAATPFVVTMDADGQHRVEDVARLLEAMQSRDADLVIGARLVNDTSGAYRRVGKGLIRLIALMLFPVRIQDLNSGFKLYRTEVVRRLLPWCPGSMAFSDVVTLLHLNLDLYVVEIPVETRPRQGGRSTINTMTAVETVQEIINVLMWFKPLRIFLPVAALLMLLGIGWALPFLLAGRGMSGFALLLMLTGLLAAMLGLLAEQLAALRRVDLSDISTRPIVPG